MSKTKAALVLMTLVMTLVAINTVMMPHLAFFMKVGTMSSMFTIGSTVGKALATAFGSSIFEFVGIVLFLA